MNNQICAGLLSLLMGLMAAGPTAAQQQQDDDFYRPWVDYRNGEISVAFNQTPIRFALQAFHAVTGLRIVIPAQAETEVVTLHLDRQPVELAVRSLISSIGYKNFALMYDENGRPNQAVVLGTQVDDERVVRRRNSESAPLQLTAQERDQLLSLLRRWQELSAEERGRIEDRLKSLPASDDRDLLIQEYGRQVLGLAPEVIASNR